MSQRDELYEYAERNAPAVYEAIQIIDRHIADHAEAGQELLRQRYSLLMRMAEGLALERGNRMIPLLTVFACAVVL